MGVTWGRGLVVDTDRLDSKNTSEFGALWQRLWHIYVFCLLPLSILTRILRFNAYCIYGQTAGNSEIASRRGLNAKIEWENSIAVAWCVQVYRQPPNDRVPSLQSQA